MATFPMLLGLIVLFVIFLLKIMEGISKGGFKEIFFIIILLFVGMISFLFGIWGATILLGLFYMIYSLFREAVLFVINKAYILNRKKEFEKEINKMMVQWNRDKTSFPVIINISKKYMEGNFFDKAQDALIRHEKYMSDIGKERLAAQKMKNENIIKMRKKKYSYKCVNCGKYFTPDKLICSFCGKRTDKNIRDIIKYKLQHRYGFLLLAIAFLISLPTFFPPGNFVLGIATLAIWVAIVLTISDISDVA